MDWIGELIYFNDETDFIIWSKLYIDICINKILEKIVEKIYLIYIYIQTGTTEKYLIINSMSEWINMLIYEKTISNSAWGSWWLHWLKLCISCINCPGSKSQHDGRDLEVRKCVI